MKWIVFLFAGATSLVLDSYSQEVQTKQIPERFSKEIQKTVTARYMLYLQQRWTKAK